MAVRVQLAIAAVLGAAGAASAAVPFDDGWIAGRSAAMSGHNTAGAAARGVASCCFTPGWILIMVAQVGLRYGPDFPSPPGTRGHFMGLSEAPRMPPRRLATPDGLDRWSSLDWRRGYDKGYDAAATNADERAHGVARLVCLAAGMAGVAVGATLLYNHR